MKVGGDGCGARQDNTGDLSAILLAAHELKSPVALIRQLSLFAQEAGQKDRNKDDLLRKITLISERSLRLTSDLTKTARLEDALFSLEPIDPSQVCLDVIHELSPLARAYNKKIELKGCRRTPLVIANRDLLRRVLINFMDNALSYCGGHQPIKLKIQTFYKQGFIRVSVRDYGPAITNSLARKIKTELLIKDSNFYSRPQSSGLGVYISSQFAKVMGGLIGVIRHHDGVTFYINLQISKQLNLL